MPKMLAICGMVVSVVVLLVFGLDLAVGQPFQKISMPMDIGFVVAAVLLAYMSWTTFREQP